MLNRRNRVADPKNGRIIRVRVPEMGTGADSPVPRKGEQDPLLSLGRNQVLIRNLTAPPVISIISENAGGRRELAIGVDNWGIRYATARKDRIPVGLDPSLLFRDPRRQELLQAEVEVRIRQ